MVADESTNERAQEVFDNMRMPLLFALLLLCLRSPDPIISFTELLSIGDHITTWLSNVQCVAFLPDGSLIVSDKLDYQLKKIDRSGKLIAAVGQRVRNPGEFRGPGPIAWYPGMIAVADFSTPRIQIFTTEFRYQRTFHALGPVFDLCFDAQGNLWTGVQTRDKTNELVQYHVSGRVLRTVALRNTTGGMFEDIYSMAMSRDGTIIIAYIVQNTIEVWDTLGRFLRQFSVPGLPRFPPTKSFSTGLFSESVKIPEGNIFWSIALDPHDRLFILGADYAEHPGQDLYVLDLSGKPLATAKLPQRSPHIWIGPDGYLYSIVQERTIIKKYRMKYKGI